MSKPFTKQDVEKIKTLKAGGLNFKQISEHFPTRKADGIRRIAREHGLAEPVNSWSEEGDLLLREKLKEDLSYKEIAKFFPDRTWIAVKRRANYLGAKSDYRFRRYDSNNTFWDVPNEVNCYWAGFIAADGCVTKNGEEGAGYSLSISLSSIDKEHLVQFLKDCGANNPIGNGFSHDKRTGNTYPNSRVCLANMKWKRSLENIFNIFPRKTFTFEIPSLPEKLMHCWMAGYIDGDGTYGISKGYFRMGAVSAVKHTIDKLFEFVNTFPKEKCKNQGAAADGKGCFQFAVTGRQAIEASHYLMSLPCPHLRRKYEKVQNYLISHPSYNLSLPPYDEHLASLRPKDVTI